MYQQGDIVSVSFPFTNLTNAKLRPALVISNHSIDNTGDVIIVMITSKEKQDGLNITCCSECSHQAMSLVAVTRYGLMKQQVPKLAQECSLAKRVRFLCL